MDDKTEAEQKLLSTSTIVASFKLKFDATYWCQFPLKLSTCFIWLGIPTKSFRLTVKRCLWWLAESYYWFDPGILWRINGAYRAMPSLVPNHVELMYPKWLTGKSVGKSLRSSFYFCRLVAIGNMWTWRCVKVAVQLTLLSRTCD